MDALSDTIMYFQFDKCKFTVLYYNSGEDMKRIRSWRLKFPSGSRLLTHLVWEGKHKTHFPAHVGCNISRYCRLNHNLHVNSPECIFNTYIHADYHRPHSKKSLKT